MFIDQSKATAVVEAYKLMNEEFQEISSYYCFDPYVFSFEKSPLELFYKDIMAMFAVYDEASEMCENRKRLQASFSRT